MIESMATAAFGRIRNDKNEILLVQLAEPFRHAHRWNFPGGVIEDDDESIEHGLKREVLEETNVIVDIGLRIDQFHTDDPENSIHIFECSYLSGELVFQEYEIENIGWFSQAEALKLPLAFNVKDYIERLAL